MKGAFFGLGGKEISLVMISLMCLSFLLWGWQKTALLTVFLPPQTLHLAPKIAGDEVEETIHKNIVEVKANSSSSVLKKIIAENPKIIGKDGSTAKDIVKVGGEKKLLKDNRSKNREKNLDSVVLDNSTSSFINSSISQKDDENLTGIVNVEGSNYAKGKWVVDNKRPLYSGFGCKQWLSAMWACRMSQRTDFDYEKLKWQPKKVQMEEFDASKFLRRMQHKTLAFIGDSLGRQQFQSLMCMITAGEQQKYVKDVGKDYGLVIAPGGKRPDGWAYHFPNTNTTVLYYWSASLCDLEPINKTKRDTDHAMHLDRPPAFLCRYINKFDVLVLNTGHHWNRGKLNANRWVMHVGGKPNTDKRIALLSNAKNLTIHSVVHWVNSQLPHNPTLKAFYRTISPRHFIGGEWNTGGSCDNTKPMSIGKDVLQDESSDDLASSAVKGTGVRLLDITALSQLRDEGHISRFSKTAAMGAQDCLHWCLPGVPDTWNEILFAQL